jgi:hypothetical protein
MRRLRLAILISLLAFASACGHKVPGNPAGPGVDPAYACLTGTVTWDGEPVPGAIVTLHTVLDSVWTVTTDSSGAFCTGAPVGVTVMLATHASRAGQGRVGSGLTVPAKPANCGGACEVIDLPLRDNGLNGARFVLSGWVHALSPVPTEAYVFAFAQDEWTGLEMRNARIRLSSASGSTVTLAYRALNHRYEAGWPAGTLLATLPIALGETYRLDADIDADGVDDGSGSLSVPAMPHSVRLPNFDVAWRIDGDRTATRYEANVVGLSFPFLQTAAEAGDSALAHFTGAPPGGYDAGVRAYRGPGPVTMLGGTPNVVGPEMAGFFWGVVEARLDSFQVGTALLDVTRGRPPNPAWSTRAR